MRYHVLGGTGIEASVHCLGTMMSGTVGDQDGCGRAALTPHRFDPAIPENRVKRDAVEKPVEVAARLGRTLPSSPWPSPRAPGGHLGGHRAAHDARRQPVPAGRRVAFQGR